MNRRQVLQGIGGVALAGVVTTSAPAAAIPWREIGQAKVEWSAGPGRPRYWTMLAPGDRVFLPEPFANHVWVWQKDGDVLTVRYGEVGE